MGITDTIANIKDFFIRWHDEAHTYTDTSLSERINDIEEKWTNSFKNSIESTINNFNKFYENAGNTKLTDITSSINNKADRSELVNNITKYNVFPIDGSTNTQFNATNGWVTYTRGVNASSNYLQMYINPVLRLVYGTIDVYVNHTPGSSWRTISSITIPKEYCPPKSATTPSSPYITVRFNPGGSITYQSNYSKSKNDVHILASAMWHY